MGVWENSAYAWVVICKNKKAHRETNVLFGHKIPLGETDPYEPPPALDGPFTAYCDECGKEYSYDPGDVLEIRTGTSCIVRAAPAVQVEPHRSQ